MHKLTRSSYFWNHSSELDTLVNQNSHAAPIRSPVHGQTGFSKSRGLRASVTFFPLPHPAPSTFLLSPDFSRGPDAKASFARPEFRSHRSGTLATQATCSLAVNVAKQLMSVQTLMA